MTLPLKVSGEENTLDIESVPGEERAAILLLSLNEEDAAGIIRHLEPNKYSA